MHVLLSVIWRGDSVIEGVPETLEMLRKMVRERCSTHTTSANITTCTLDGCMHCSAFHTTRPLVFSSNCATAFSRQEACACEQQSGRSPWTCPSVCLQHGACLFPYHAAVLLIYRDFFLLTGQEAFLCDQQLDQIPRWLPEEVHQPGPQRAAGKRRQRQLLTTPSSHVTWVG